MTHTAVIAGVGPGLGESLARKFVAEGCQVGLFARSDEYLEDLADDLGDDALAVPTDITDPDQVKAGFEAVRDAFGPVDVLVNHASGGAWRGLRDISPDEFEGVWRTAAYGALLCSQEAVEDMLAGDGGTIIFTGATSAVRGREGAIGFSAAKYNHADATPIQYVLPALQRTSRARSREDPNRPFLGDEVGRSPDPTELLVDR